MRFGDLRDELYVDINACKAVWAGVDLQLSAGGGDDYIYLANSDSTASTAYPDPSFKEMGLYGDYDLGAGDDVLEINPQRWMVRGRRLS